MWKICVGCEAAEVGKDQLYPQLWAQANVVSGCFGSPEKEQWMIAQDKQCRNVGALRSGNPNSTYIPGEVQHHWSKHLPESLFQWKAKALRKILKKLTKKPCQPFFLSYFFFPSLHIFSLLSEVVPTWRCLCSPSMAMIHQLTLFYFLLCAFPFILSLGSFLPMVAQSLKPLTTSWQLRVKGFVNPQGSNSAAQQWKSGGCSADVWDYSDPPQAMQRLQILTSSNICRACTRRDTWQQLQREYWDSQRKKKWALVGPFLLTWPRLC